METIYAIEPNFILSYLDKKENLTEELKGSLGGMSERVPSDIMIVDGETAIIDISGPLSPDGPDAWDKFLGIGGTGYNDIIEALGIATSDEMVKNITLKMNTPGGTVDGCDQVARMVAECGKKKKITAENHGMIASAGYWIASQASEIVAMGPAAETGSIGVIVVGYDFSDALKKMGIKKHRIVSANAPRKAPGLDSEQGRGIIQDRVDAIERVFMARVAEGRGIDIADVRAKYGKGDIFIADDPDDKKKDALSIGMIDKVLNGISGGHGGASGDSQEASVAPVIPAAKDDNDNNLTGGKKAMGLKDLMAEDTGLDAEVKARETAAYEKGQQSGKDQVNERVKKASAFIGGEYPKAIQDLAIKVVNGESEFSSLEAVATMHDAQKETDNSQAAQGADAGANPDVPAEPINTGAVADTGIISSDGDIEAAVADLKKEVF